MIRNLWASRSTVLPYLFALLLVTLLACSYLTSLTGNDQVSTEATVTSAAQPTAMIAAEQSTAERWFLLGRPGGELIGGHETGSIVISTANPSHMYIPLGENGLLISTDSGQSWTNVFEELLSLRVVNNVTQVLADPFEANTIYALMNGTVAVSKNLGRNWEVLLTRIDEEGQDRPLAAIALSSNGQTIYAVSQSGFHVSNDQGRTWSFYYSDILPTGYEPQVKTAVDAQDPNIAYMVVNGRLFATSSGGHDWSSPGMISAISVRQVLADRILTGLAYALTQENALYRTLDGGKSWGLIDDLNRYGEPVGATFNSDPVLLAAWNGSIYIRGTAKEGGTENENSCGLALFVSEDQGATWKQLDHFPIIHFGCGVYECTNTVYSLGIHPDDPSRLYSIVNHVRGGTHTISFLISSDSGNTWELQEP